MATKAIKFYDGTSYLLPVTTSDLVQMNGTTQSLTTYINDMKGSIANSAKMTFVNQYNAQHNIIATYAYISPTGNKDTENGSVLEFKRGNNIQIDGQGDTITISSINTKVTQYPLETTAKKYPFLTRYTDSLSSNTGYTRYTVQNANFDSTVFAYVNPSLNVSYFQYAYSTEFTENGTTLANKYAAKSHTHTISIDTTVSSADHRFPVAIKYDTGNPSSNSAAPFEGETGVTIQKKIYAGSSYISISYTPDHIGSGTTGHLTYWKSGTNHASLNSSYGSNNENNVQLHWIDNGVLKNVSVGVGSNSIPTYVDSSGHIKQVTSIDSSLYTNTDTKVQSQSSTSNGSYPFLTKSTTGIDTLTSTALQSGNSTKYAYYNPSLGVAYLPYAYSTEFTENGTKLSNKYASINHSHGVTFEFDSQQYTDTNDTVQVISYFNYPLATEIYLDTVDCTTITYTSTSVPTKKYVDDNFATKTELGNIQTGSEYTIVAASNSTATNPTLGGFVNAYLNLVNTTTNSVEKSIYIHGNNDGTSVALTGGNVIDLGINHTQDHTGTGSTGCLTYWETNDEHTNVTSSYGANTINAVGIHYVDSGVLKNVTVSSGSSTLPVYIDSGVIKPVTSTSLLKVYQKTSGTTNAKYPFLTKYTSDVSEITSGDYSRITSNGTDDTLFAYVNPSTKISYFQYAYAGEFTEGGMRLEDKYALKGTGGGSSSLDYTVVNNNMDAITIF